MKIESKEDLLREFRRVLRVAVPFEGSDESWKFQYGENWETKKKEYLDLCKEHLERAKKKFLIDSEGFN